MPLREFDLVALAKFTVFFPFAAGVIGIVWLLVPAWRSPRYGRGLDYITLVASFLSLVLSSIMAFSPPDEAITLSWPVPFVGETGFLIDAMSLYFILLVNVIAFFASWSAVGYREGIITGSRRQSPAFFHTLVNFFHVTMLLVPLVDNLIALWIAIESTTLVSTLLVSFQDKKNSWEAAWKYLIITSTGIIFALLGTMFLGNAAKSLIPTIAGDPNRVMNWTFLMQYAKDLSPDFVKLSFLFVLVGYGTKAGFAPMHTWLPDGHGEAPAPISALLSGVLLKSALYAILRFYTITNAVLGEAQFTSTILLGSGLFSLILATPFILKENRFKRVLAYHSLEHMGIITFGIGIGGPVALFGALLHTLNHAITKALMFLSFGNIQNRYGQIEVTGVLRSMPWTGAILTLGGLALVGSPPFNIFMSEFIILWGALANLNGILSTSPANTSQWIVIAAVVLFIISTTLIFYGLIKHLAQLVLHKATDDPKLKESFAELAPLIFLLIVAFLFGLKVWPPINNLVDKSVTIILFMQSQ
jgi:hydrogenase-4 component F